MHCNFLLHVDTALTRTVTRTVAGIERRHTCVSYAYAYLAIHFLSSGSKRAACTTSLHARVTNITQKDFTGTINNVLLFLKYWLQDAAPSPGFRHTPPHSPNCLGEMHWLMGSAITLLWISCCTLIKIKGNCLFPTFLACFYSFSTCTLTSFLFLVITFYWLIYYPGT